MEMHKEPEELREFFRRRTSRWRVWEDIQNGGEPYPDSIIDELAGALENQLMGGLFLKPRTMSSIEDLHKECLRASKKIDSFLTSEDSNWADNIVDDYDLLTGSLYYSKMLTIGFNLMTNYGGLMQLSDVDLSEKELNHLNELRKDMFSFFHKVMDFSLYTLNPSYTYSLIDKTIMSRKDKMEYQYKELEFWVEKCADRCSETMKDLWFKFYQIDNEALNLATKSELSKSNESKFNYIDNAFSCSKEDMDKYPQLMGFIEETSSPRRLFRLSNTPNFSKSIEVLNGKNLELFLEVVDRRNAIICGMNPELRRQYDKLGADSKNKNTANDRQQINTETMRTPEELLDKSFCPSLFQSVEATEKLREIVQGKIKSEVCGRAAKNSENWTWAHVRRAMVRCGFFGECPDGKSLQVWEDDAISDTDFGNAINSCDSSITSGRVKTQCINHKSKHNNCDENIVLRICEYLKPVAEIINLP